MSPFFPMPRREAAALCGLILFSTAAFLPVFGEVTVLGVALFGWLMALLLLGSPALLLLLLLAERPRGADAQHEMRDEPGEPQTPNRS